MAYFLFVAGVLLIILSIRISLKRPENIMHTDGTLIDDGQFEDIFTGSVVSGRLEKMDERLSSLENIMSELRDILGSVAAGMDSVSVPDSEPGDINARVQNLKKKNLSAEEIASTLGITKGEVLLRLGMKK